MGLTQQLKYSEASRKIQDMVDLHRAGKLHLNPNFQRGSVWGKADRSELIKSVLRHFPIPALFLHQRPVGGNLHFDVIDGKQRLETFFYFMGVIRGHSFSVRTSLDEDGTEEEIDWDVLRDKNLRGRINGYDLHVIFVEGELSQIIELFVKINSTGRPLSSQERRHAKFFGSPFLKKATALADAEKEALKARRIMSASQVSRMKHIELVGELMLSCDHGDVVNKKKALDQAMAQKGGFSEKQAEMARRSAKSALNRVYAMFPNLHQTRFAQLSDFYSLVIVIHKLQTEGCILTSGSKNRTAWVFLREFATKVEELRDLHKRGKNIPGDLEIYRDYLQTVLEGTDTFQNRKRREGILRQLIESQFRKKDKDRVFSQAQRRILWNLNKKQICAGCENLLAWPRFEVDHVYPYSKGGRTDTLNAALLCPKCNRKKSGSIAKR
jgi:5-methylcytosine-specific restriction endonuclease McrA